MANQQQSAEEIFEAALDMPVERRPAYLVEACGGSSQLRDDVERLLRDYQQMGDFLDDSPVGAKKEDAPEFVGQTLERGT